MVLIYDKCYSISALIINDESIYSPSMPDIWKWAIGKNGHTYTLGIFDNLKDAKSILKILFKTYPAITIKAIPFIKKEDKTKILNLLQNYHIQLNHIYLESFMINNDGFEYNIYQFKKLFLQDKLA